ncbi:MAG: GNAT family N-acetyltransferase [Nocardioidaceae bacterium]
MTLQEVSPSVIPWRLTTRPTVNGDASMLRDLYLDVLRTEHEEELQPHQRTLILMSAQQAEADLDRRYPDLTRLTVCADGLAMGRMMLSSAGTHIRLVNLTLLPHMRGQGIGSHLVSDLLREASAESYTMHAAVDKESRAVRFLERLGFSYDIDRGSVWDMVCTPEPAVDEL